MYGIATLVANYGHEPRPLPPTAVAPQRRREDQREETVIPEGEEAA